MPEVQPAREGVSADSILGWRRSRPPERAGFTPWSGYPQIESGFNPSIRCFTLPSPCCPAINAYWSGSYGGNFLEVVFEGLSGTRDSHT